MGCCGNWCNACCPRRSYNPCYCCPNHAVAGVANNGCVQNAYGNGCNGAMGMRNNYGCGNGYNGVMGATTNGCGHMAHGTMGCNEMAHGSMGYENMDEYPMDCDNMYYANMEYSKLATW